MAKYIDNSQNLKSYLDFVHKTPELSRAEELNLFTSLKSLQTNRFKKCVKYSMFRKILRVELLRTLKANLTEVPSNPPIHNPPPLMRDYIDQLKVIAKGLEASDLDQRQKSLDKVKVSGNTPYSVFKIVEAKLKIFNMKSYLQSCMNYFKISDVKVLFTLARRCLLDRTLMSALSERLSPDLPSDIIGRLKKIDDMSIAFGKSKDKLSKKDIRGVLQVSKIMSDIEIKIIPLRDELVERNLRLVISRAKYQVNRGLEFRDLIQAGNLGLLKAVSKYDPDMNTKFSTLAVWWIDLDIQREIANQARIIKIPSHIQGLMHKIKYMKLTPGGSVLSKEDIAAKLGVGVKTVGIALEAFIFPLGLEWEDEDGTTNSLHLRQTDESSSPFNTTCEKLKSEKVRKVLNKLEPETERIIRMLYGIGVKPRSKGEIIRNSGSSRYLTDRRLRLGFDSMRRLGGLSHELD